jgi:predicted tellurium resistance membrane protein TerC
MGLSDPLFGVPKFWTLQFDEMHGISGRDLILLLGGLFLIGKATYEIHDKLEGKHESASEAKFSSFPAVIVQVVLIDIVFSLDSVITAVGMVKVNPNAQWVGLTIMITAVILAIGVMLMFAGVIAAFVEKHPTMKMLALSFLLLIGVTLVTEGFHVQIPKGYVYFAMAFSLTVEIINLRMRKLTSPVVLQQSYVDAPPGSMSSAVNEQPAN